MQPPRDDNLLAVSGETKIGTPLTVGMFACIIKVFTPSANSMMTLCLHSSSAGHDASNAYLKKGHDASADLWNCSPWRSTILLWTLKQHVHHPLHLHGARQPLSKPGSTSKAWHARMLQWKSTNVADLIALPLCEQPLPFLIIVDRANKANMHEVPHETSTWRSWERSILSYSMLLSNAWSTIFLDGLKRHAGMTNLECQAATKSLCFLTD